MKYFTADDARKAVTESGQYGRVGAILPSLLERIRQLAESGQRETICEGIGTAADLPALVEALQQLGYAVEDISGKSTPGGHAYLNRSLRITW